MGLPFLRCSMLAAALVALAAATPTEALALSEGDLQLFPIAAPPEGATVISTQALLPLTQGSGYSYSVLRTGVFNPSGNSPDPADPASWTILSYEGTVTFFGEAPPEFDLLLVFTSLREGDFNGGPLPPRIDGGYVLPSFSGLGSSPLYVLDPADGVITDAEGDLFLALSFPATPNLPQTFTFDVALREPLDGTLQHFNRGFVLPEPSSGALLGLAIGAMMLGGLARRKLGGGR